MEKLELKHIVGYLPYNLKVLSGFGEYSEIDSLYFSKDDHKRPSLNLMVSRFPKGFRGENFTDIKPILRPLSNLTKEIEVNGEKFIPLKRIVEIRSNTKEQINYTFSEAINCISVCYNYPSGINTVHDSIFIYKDNSMSEFGIQNVQYWIIQKLYEWHFDIHGLISAGLAIDKNTLS